VFDQVGSAVLDARLRSNEFMDGMSLKVSVRGKQQSFSAIQFDANTLIVLRGRLLKIGEIYDEQWLESRCLSDPEKIVEKLAAMSPKPDLFCFSERLPEVSPKHPYFFEWDNLAVCSFSSYAEWFDKKVHRNTRNAIRQSVRKGVRTEVVRFGDVLVEGIWSIFNECPVRQGKKFWHFGKPVAVLREEIASYLERSILTGAFYEGELVGFSKMVVDDSVAHFMQILSKVGVYDKRVANSLVSMAVEICESRGISHLVYGKFDYEHQQDSSLAQFKAHNGFERVQIPRYYVPLTLRGQFALKLKLHKGLKSCVPGVVWRAGIWLRRKSRTLRRWQDSSARAKT